MGVCVSRISSLYSPEEAEFFAALDDNNKGEGPHDNDRSIRKAKELIQRYPSVMVASQMWSQASTSWHAATLKGSLDLLQYMHDFMLNDPHSPIPISLPEEVRKEQLKEHINLLNFKGQSPLMIAAARGHIECIKFLLSIGASPLKPDRSHGLTALHFAARAGKADSIRAILENLPSSMSFFETEMTKDAQSSSGLTALHFAVGFDHLTCIEALLSFNCSLTVRTKFPTQELGCYLHALSTPLHVAAHLLNLPAAISLLTHHAIAVVHSPSIPDIRLRLNFAKHIPLQIARNATKNPSHPSQGQGQGNAALLLEILKPSTDLIATLDVKMPETGCPTLAVIASAVLRKKLLGDLEVAAQQTRFTRASACNDDDDEEEEDDEGEEEFELDSEGWHKEGTGEGHGEAVRDPRGSPAALDGSVEIKAKEEEEVFDAAQEFVISPLCSPRTMEIEPSPSQDSPTSPFSAPLKVPLPPTLSILGAQSPSKKPSPLSRFGRMSNAIHPEPGPTSLERVQSMRTSRVSRSTAADRRTHNSVAFDHLSPSGRATSTRASMSQRGSKRTPSSRQMKDTEEEEDACFICLDAAPEVGVAGCVHKLCKDCANQMIERLHRTPLTCPFCRKDINGFVSIT